MAPAKKMRRIPLPKRALIKPYSSPTDTPTPALEGVAVDGSQTIAPSPSQSNALSRSETVAPSPSETNARADPFMQYQWTVADPATKGAIVQAVRDKFEIGENYEENSLSHQVMENKCYIKIVSVATTSANLIGASYPTITLVGHDLFRRR
ncbi:uncharacterized protein LOC114301186 [Camellia sinensis]|uniref:uncharacterized protein LOC114301186 n=1 Tax=Camellia sinensis TaxID=4442 RepID=UPI001036DECE|nr:uncharacterized protein LOC114301186 [Camellia sinensis]